MFDIEALQHFKFSRLKRCDCCRKWFLVVSIPGFKGVKKYMYKGEN